MKGKKTEVPKLAEMPKFIVPPNERFNARVTFNHTPEIAELLKRYLSQEAIMKFKETIFGHILDVGVVIGQGQVVHGILLREVEANDAEAIVFNIGGTNLRFGLKEFGVVSGLKIYGSTNIPVFEEKDHRLKNLYFKEDASVKKQTLFDSIKYKRWNNDDDAVKLAVLYVIHTYVLSSRPETHISRDDFAMVESGKYADFPWGLVSFRMLCASLKGRLAKRQVVEGDSKSYHYKVDGCPAAFQTWFYECCPRMSGLYCLRLGSGWPRMCNWSTQGSSKVHLDALNKAIFYLPGLVVNNIVPTATELKALDIGNVGEASRAGDVPNKSRDAENLNEKADVHSRFDSLEGIVMNISNDFDVFKAFVLKSLETVDQSMQQLARRMDDIAHKTSGPTEDIPGKTVEENTNVEGNIGNDGPQGPSDDLEDEIFDDLDIPDLFKMASKIGDEAVRGMNVGKDKNLETDNETATGSVGDQSVKNSDGIKIVDGRQNVEEDAILNPGLEKGKTRATFKGVLDEDISQFQVVQKKPRTQNLGKKAKDKDVPKADVEEDEDHVVLSKIKERKKAKGNGKAKIDIQYPFKGIFGSIGEFVKKDGKFNVMRGGYPLNYEYDLTDIDVFQWMKGLTTFMGEDDVGKDGGPVEISQIPDKAPMTLDFAIIDISSRKWFRELNYFGQYLSDSHINVFFYYLRKLLKYGRVKNKITTTDDAFDQLLRGLQPIYHDPKGRKNQSCFTKDSTVAQYMLGKAILAARPWSSVDEVLMPVNTNDHWIMVVLNIKRKELIVFDSIRSPEHDEHVAKELRRYTELLPYFMCLLGIWPGQKNKAQKVKFTTTEPMVVRWQNGLPIQTAPDCGAYVMAFSEYYATKRIEMITPDFNIDAFREKVACLLFHYGNMKFQDGLKSDDEM